MSDLFQNHAANSGPVECLGQTFPSDEARRAHYLKLLAEKLKDHEFRKVEGFPIGSDEAILALSDPPFYTACPNPFLVDFVKVFGKSLSDSDDYTKLPFASDVSEGRHTWLYKAHAYHTKVPPKAIQKYLEHYTRPGDIVLDAFCGSGMSALAAAMCSPARSVIAADLSPAASFISYGHAKKVDPFAVVELGKKISAQLDKELGWLYEVKQDDGSKVVANYFVWTDVFTCYSCQGEIKFFDAAFNQEEKSFSENFPCPHCGSENSKAKSERSKTTHFDHLLNKPWEHYKQDLALVAIPTGNRRQARRRATSDDQDLIRRVLQTPPAAGGARLAARMLGRDGQWGDQWKNCMHLRPVTHAHQLFFPGQIRYLARFLELIDFPDPVHQSLVFVVSSILLKCSRLMRYMSDGIGRIQNGVIYVASCSQDMRLTHMLKISLRDIERSVAEGLWRKLPNHRDTSRAGLAVSTSSATKIPVPDSSIDYIFVDPPFGGNIPYSEVNFMWETLLGVFTGTNEEAVSSPIQKKGIREYQSLMKSSFDELYRVLKPGRWMTVEFSNTKASIWNSIQTSLQEAGFVVANVSALDKKQGSFKAVTTTMAVKQDLVISAYKPDNALEVRLTSRGVTADSVWDFVRSHLGYLPVVKFNSGTLEFVVERDPRILFDRLVAWFVRHNTLVPISSQEFQAGLPQRFVIRDGMIFSPDQVAEYDKERLQVAIAPQMEMFVSDERSAIDWLTDFLKLRPSTYQEVHTDFISQLGAGWKKHESKPELSALLEDNFIQYDGTGEVPSQIHSYLSTNHKDLRGLEKNNPTLVSRAKDRWYVPDPNKAQDLEKKRERALLKEFDHYRAFTGRRLKEFRLEALRAGFRAAWGNKDYQTIIDIAAKVPESALQEDEKLLTLYDLALTRTEDAL